MDKKQYYLKLYPYIVAWSQKLGSYGYYIEQQVQRAIETEAPKDACFYLDEEEEWKTYQNMSDKLKAELDEYVKGTKGGVIINWAEDTTIINNKLVTLEYPKEWHGFIKWVEGTSLYYALKNDPYGTEIRGHTPEGDINLTLFLTRDKPINSASDLPIEILQNFYINSPWYKQMAEDGIQKLLTNDSGN